jgi:hypothetical protein
MSATATRTTDLSAAAKPGTVDMKLEVITLPVADPERAWYAAYMVAEQAGTELPT